MTRDHVPDCNQELFDKLLENGRELFTQEPFAAKITNNPLDEIVSEKLEEGEKEVKLEYNCISEAVKKYNKENDNSWIIEDEDEDEEENSFAVDLPKTGSISTVKKTSILQKPNSVSPIRMKANSRTDNSKQNV